VTTFPIKPLMTHYRGPNAILRRKAADANLLAHKILRQLNENILADPAEMQQHSFQDIADALGCPVDAVRSAIPAGGHYGINLRVTERDREIVRAELGIRPAAAKKRAAIG